MNMSALDLVTRVLPQTPMLLGTAIASSLGFSQHAGEWDTKMEVTMSMIRAMMSGSKPTQVAVQQQLTLKDPGAAGRMWISRVSVPLPDENDLLAQFFRAFDSLKTAGDEEFDEVAVGPVEAEWTGFRAAADKKTPEEDLPEMEKYSKLMAETTTKVTTLYFHGGAYFMMDPATHRPSTSNLARHTGGRVLSVRYRLAPQGPFPAAVLDALHAYLYLLYPPPGSLHEPVPAANIVFAGDSAGSGLSMSLLQLILTLHRLEPSSAEPKVNFHGKQVSLPIPGGVAICSPWLDVTASLESYKRNTKYDYLPSPSNGKWRKFATDDVWPPKPPLRARTMLYADNTCLAHPLVSPLTAASWAGAPPVYIMVGDELLSDEIDFVASRLAQDSVTVVYERYATMPHCFSQVFPDMPGSRKAGQSWAGFIRDCVDGKEFHSKASIIAPKSLEETTVDFPSLARGMSYDQVLSLVQKSTKGLGELSKAQSKL